MRIAATFALAVLLSGGASGAPRKTAQPVKLRVSAAAGIDIFQSPGASEGSGVDGLAEVTRPDAQGGDEPVTGATVTINGKRLPEAPEMPGFYEAGGLARTIVPGATLNLIASKDAETASVTFKCPPVPTFTSPAEKTTVAAGKVVKASWSGRVAYNGVAFQPQLFFRSWDASANDVGNVYNDEAKTLSGTQTSASLPVPTDSNPGYVLELKVPGDFADQASTGGAAICVVHARVHLKAQ